MTRVVAFVPDLMDRSKVAAAGADVTFVATPAAQPATKPIAVRSQPKRVEILMLSLLPRAAARGGPTTHICAHALTPAKPV